MHDGRFQSMKNLLHVIILLIDTMFCTIFISAKHSYYFMLVNSYNNNNNDNGIITIRHEIWKKYMHFLYLLLLLVILV